MDTTRRSQNNRRAAAGLAAMLVCAIAMPARADQDAPAPNDPRPPAPAPAATAGAATTAPPAATAATTATAATADTFATILERLDAPDYSVRETASEQLAKFPGGPEEIARRIPKGASLSPEQWARLDDAMLRRFMATPRGGLGASLMVRDPRMGVELTSIMDNFPASKQLRAGDVVAVVDGIRLASPNNGSLDLPAAIVSHDPGETLPITIIRDGQMLEMRVPLGGFADLQSRDPIRPDVLLKGWDLRRARIGVEPPPAAPISVRVTPVDWPEQRLPGRLLGPVGVVPGGRSAFLPDPDAIRRVAMSPDAAILQQQQQQLLQLQKQQQLRKLALPRDRAADQKALVQRQIQQEYDRIELWQQQLRDPGVKPNERVFLQQSIEASTAQIDRLKRFLQQLDGR